MADPQFTDCTLSIVDGVATFTMNRPDTRNAFTPSMRQDLVTLGLAMRDNAAVQVLIITGKGAFSAGGDVKAMNDGFSPAEARRFMMAHHEFLQPLIELEMPVIAAVTGAAFGGGFSLALGCDFILATPKARFCSVFGRIGVIPDMAIMRTLPRMVGLQRAKEICYTARVVEPEEAKALGLVYAVVPEDRLLAEAQAMANRLKVGSKLATGLAKKVLNGTFETDYATLAGQEAALQSVCLASDYHKQQVARFNRKEPLPYDWDALSKRATE